MRLLPAYSASGPQGLDTLHAVLEAHGVDPRPPAHVENLSGLVERVTFFNEENGFSVLKVKVKGFSDLITVVGSLPSANAGEWITAEGHWIQDREFGRQFRAVLLKSSAPTTLEGIEKYLGSGMVKGIGPVYAQKNWWAGSGTRSLMSSSIDRQRSRMWMASDRNGV